MIVNNQETNIDDNVFYVDGEGQIHEAVIRDVEERDGLSYADLEIDGKIVKDVPHNTSPERHSWNHPMSEEERATHYEPDFYG